jgi:Domain of unknown function (DUF4389)
LRRAGGTRIAPPARRSTALRNRQAFREAGEPVARSYAVGENRSITGRAAIFEVSYPQRFDRIQVVLRIVIIWLAALIGIPFGWILYLGFPVLAAVLVSQKDSGRYLTEDGPRVTRLLAWVMAVSAYMWILTDKLPASGEATVRFEVEPSGTPSPGSALVRMLTALPNALVLAVLMFVSAIVWVIAAIWILIAESYPEWLYGFQRGVVRWLARLLAYLASLVDDYPPFSLDTGAHS